MDYFLIESRAFSNSSHEDFNWGTEYPNLDQIVFELFNVSNSSWPGILSARFSTNNGSSYDSGSNYKYNGWAKSKPSGSPPLPYDWPQLKATLNSTQTNVTGDGTVIKVAFDAVTGDIYGDMNITSNKGVFTARNTGFYRFKGHTHLLGSVNGGRCETRIIVSDGQAVRCGSDDKLSPVTFGENAFDYEAVIYMAGGSTCYVEHKVSNTSKDVDIYGDPYFTWIYVEQVGSQQYGLVPTPSVLAADYAIVTVDASNGDSAPYGVNGTFTLKTAGVIGSQNVHSTWNAEMQVTDAGADIMNTEYKGAYFGAAGSRVNGVRFLNTGASPAPNISGLIKVYGLL